MREFTEWMMERVRDDFIEFAAQGNALCEVRDMRFDGGTMPDYAEKCVQLTYMLRYFPAYLVEYYELYKELLQTGFLQDTWDVLSVGSGCGVDYYALQHVLADNHMHDCEFSYTGIDRVDWEYQPDTNEDAYTFLQLDLDDPLTIAKDLNILMLPKSVGDLSSRAFMHLVSAIRFRDLSSPRIAVLASICTARDQGFVWRLVDELKEKGYSPVHQPAVFTSFAEEKWLGYINPEFYYPTELVEFTTTLASLCLQRGAYDRCEECEGPDRSPLMKNKLMNYIVIRLEK